jgi:S1-C subfamily serine protease
MKRGSLLVVFLLGIWIAGCDGANSTSSHPIGDASMPAPVLGIVVDQSMIVLHVEPGSAAEQIGIQRGDLIDAVEGIVVATNREAVRDTIRMAKANQKLHLKIRRSGMELALEVVPSSPAARPNQPTPTPVLLPQDYL